MQNFHKKDFDDFSNGEWRTDKRFTILYNAYGNILYEKSHRIVNQKLISAMQKINTGKMEVLQIKDAYLFNSYKREMNE